MIGWARRDAGQGPAYCSVRVRARPRREAAAIPTTAIPTFLNG